MQNKIRGFARDTWWSYYVTMLLRFLFPREILNDFTPSIHLHLAKFLPATVPPLLTAR